MILFYISLYKLNALECTKCTELKKLITTDIDYLPLWDRLFASDGTDYNNNLLCCFKRILYNTYLQTLLRSLIKCHVQKEKKKICDYRTYICIYLLVRKIMAFRIFILNITITAKNRMHWRGDWKEPVWILFILIIFVNTLEIHMEHSLLLIFFYHMYTDNIYDIFVEYNAKFQFSQEVCFLWY